VWIGLALLVLGSVIIRYAMRSYNTAQFLGLEEENKSNERLVIQGLNKHVRHPLYSGTILLLISFVIFKPDLWMCYFVGVSLTYLPIGIWLEERKLIQAFGEKYHNYRNSVPSIIPRLNNLK